MDSRTNGKKVHGNGAGHNPFIHPADKTTQQSKFLCRSANLK